MTYLQLRQRLATHAPVRRGQLPKPPVPVRTQTKRPTAFAMLHAPLVPGGRPADVAVGDAAAAGIGEEPRRNTRRARVQRIVDRLRLAPNPDRLPLVKRLAGYLRAHFGAGTARTYFSVAGSLHPTLRSDERQRWKDVSKDVQQHAARAAPKQALPASPAQAKQLIESTEDPVLKRTVRFLYCTASRHGDHRHMVPAVTARATTQIRLPWFKSDTTGKRLYSKYVPVSLGFPIRISPYRTLNNYIRQVLGPGYSTYSLRRGAISWLALQLRLQRRRWTDKQIATLTGHVDPSEKLSVKIYTLPEILVFSEGAQVCRQLVCELLRAVEGGHPFPTDLWA